MILLVGSLIRLKYQIMALLKQSKVRDFVTSFFDTNVKRFLYNPLLTSILIDRPLCFVTFSRIVFRPIVKKKWWIWLFFVYFDWLDSLPVIRRTAGLYKLWTKQNFLLPLRRFLGWCILSNAIIEDYLVFLFDKNKAEHHNVTAKTKQTS